MKPSLPYAFRPSTCSSDDIKKTPDDLFQGEPSIRSGHAPTHPESEDLPRFYKRLNRLLDQQVVPYTVNEAVVVAFRDVLCRKGAPDSPCYWLLMARLAELTLLCAGHYADCGEITAAGDLLINPRRTDIYMQGVVRPMRKDRYRRISEQLDPGGLSPTERLDWLRRTTTVRIAEAPLLPDFLARLEKSGWLRGAFLNRLKSRMLQVADTMRFGWTEIGPGTAGGPQADTFARPAESVCRANHLCRFKAIHYGRLGREVEQTCRSASHGSDYLTYRRRQKDAGPLGKTALTVPLSKVVIERQPERVGR